jgi:trk system potassium uptake protein TrkH
MSFASAFSILGWSLAILGGAMLGPAAAGFAMDEKVSGLIFLLSAAPTIFVGGGLIIASRGPRPHTARRESFVSVALIVLVLPVFAAIPLLGSGAIGGVLNAYFEAVSGLTTSGATVIGDLDSVDRSVVLWRSLLQWLGGVGAVVLAIVHFAPRGVGGMQLYASPLVHGEQDPLGERFRHAGISFSWVYAILTGACILALWISGLEFFDGIVLGLSTVSTGGFSPFNDSLAGLKNRTAEAVIVVFMILGATNLTLHWQALRGKGFSVYLQDPEFPLLLGLMITAGAALAVALSLGKNVDVLDAVWVGLFHAVSAISTTGFVTDQGQSVGWPVFGLMLLVILMLIGGSTGSSGGGIKVMRASLLIGLVRREFNRLAHPHGVVCIPYRGTGVEEAALRGIWAVFIAMVFTFGLLTVAMTSFGVDFQNAAYIAVSAVTNTAPMLGALVDQGVRVGDMNGGAKVALTVGMILGRLEFLSVFVLLSPLFWRR